MPSTTVRSANKKKNSATVSQEKLDLLPTEQRNPASDDLDLKSTTQILQIINQQDAGVAAVVQSVIPQIAEAVELAVDSFEKGGRLIYVGAGTSGRLGVLDASECPPTYNVSPSRVVGVIAGGPRALYSATEASEDDPALGAKDMRRLRVSYKDTVVGIAASGRTPYTIGALQYAREQCAHTVAIACVQNSRMGEAADVTIAVVTGPEVISGSTRMKAGTAQKLALNMLSTTLMVRTGHVFSNLMINVHQSNEKLVARAERILSQATGLDAKQSKALLKKARELKLAILMAKTGLSQKEARLRLDAYGENLRAAIASVGTVGSQRRGKK